MGICEHLTRKSLDLSTIDQQPIEICISGAQPIESYKPINEDENIGKPNGNDQNSNGGESTNGISSSHSASTDTAEVYVEERKLADKRDEVTFIKRDGNQVPQSERTFNDEKTSQATNLGGISKEELLTYANDPFWIRLRWICFIMFWTVWAAMLVAALLIMVKTSKCTAPSTMPWYQSGILLDAEKMIEDVNGNVVDIDNDMEFSKVTHAHGIIYELPSHLTYDVSSADVQERIKHLVANFETVGVRLILDIKPNLVLTTNSDQTISQSNEFVETDKKFDLVFMNNSQEPQKLADVVQHLIELGVRGIRFKHVESDSFERTEARAESTKLQEQTIYDSQEFALLVRNASADAFFRTIEIEFQNKLSDILQRIDSKTVILPQWNLTDIQLTNKEFSAPSLLLFMALLPGASIVPAQSQAFNNSIPRETYEVIKTLQESPSYLHGEFSIYDMTNLLAYTRLRSGNPGYLVICNPTDTPQRSHVKQNTLPNAMTVYASSYNAVVLRSKLIINDFDVPPYAVIILTYVPLNKI